MPTDLQYRSRRLLSPLKVHGGKSYLCRRLLALAPMDCSIYLENFFGGGSMTLNENLGFDCRMASDTDWLKINLFQIIQARTEELVKALRPMEYTEAVWSKAAEWCNHIDTRVGSPQLQGLDSLEAATNYLIANRMSRGGLGDDFAWSDRLRGGQPGDLNAWKTMIRNLPQVAAQLEGTTLTHGSGYTAAVQLINDPQAFIYSDPPYMPKTRKSLTAYKLHEMTVQQHKELAELYANAKCKIMISGYDCEEYARWYAGWRVNRFDMPCHAGQSEKKSRRIECVWSNFEESMPWDLIPIGNRMQ